MIDQDNRQGSSIMTFNAMTFNPVRIMMLGAIAFLSPAVLSAQDGARYLPAAMAQANQPQPGQEGQPLPGPGQQTAMPSMQDSAGSGQIAQLAKDKMFVRQAVAGGIAEVQFGQLAVQKSAGEEVRSFGQKMVDDHTAFNNEMESVADSIGVMLPKHMNKSDQAEYEKLQGMSGTDFDTEYLTLMVKNHHKDLREFRLEAASTQDPGLRDAVARGQKVIHDHMVMVDSLARSKGIAVPNHHHGNRPVPPPTQ